MKKNIIIIAAFVICAGLYPVRAYMMSSDNYRIEWDSVNIGGGGGSSQNYETESTLGEISTGESKSASYILKAGYQQMDQSTISITVAESVILTPELLAITGGIANGSTSITVTTDNAAGYTLEFNAAANPALQSGSAEFPDYTEVGVPTPDYDWSIGAASSEFGFTVWGQDANQLYKYAGNSCNQAAGTSDGSQCWNGFEGSTMLSVADSNIANSPAGTVTGVAYRAQIKSNGFQTPGNYSAIITATATVK